MPGLGETQLMFPQAYLRTESGVRMAVTMDTMELIFKDGSTYLV